MSYVPVAKSASQSSPRQADGALTLAGADLHADVAGALYWPEQGMLAVADLHLEKGSSFAARGVLLPPYDTAATLARLGALVARYAPRLVVALGDSFHDGRGPARLADTDRATLKAMQRGRDWIWIAGNHDPEPADNIGGRFLPELRIAALTFRHEPGGEDTGVIAGHLHPVARVARRGRAVSRRCFASDGVRLVMPAFGAYTGGLNVRDTAFEALFPAGFTAHLLGDGRIFAIGRTMLAKD